MFLVMVEECLGSKVRSFAEVREPGGYGAATPSTHVRSDRTITPGRPGTLSQTLQLANSTTEVDICPFGVLGLVKHTVIIYACSLQLRTHTSYPMINTRRHTPAQEA